MKLHSFADEASPSIDMQISAMQKNGIEGLEIRNVDGENIADITCEKAREVKRKLDAAGIYTFSVGSPVGKVNIEGTSFEEELDRFRHVLELAEILEAERIRMFSFYIPSGKDPDVYRDEVVERIGKYLDIARGSGVTLCHENEKGIFGDTPERCLGLFKALPELRAVFDPANFVQCKVDTVHAWELLREHVKYLHIKDADSHGLIVPAGEGIGNLEKIIFEYKSMGGEDLSLEPHLAVFDGLSALENGEKSLVGLAHRYASNEQAFDAAAKALKNILHKGCLL